VAAKHCTRVCSTSRLKHVTPLKNMTRLTTGLKCAPENGTKASTMKMITRKNAIEFTSFVAPRTPIPHPCAHTPTDVGDARKAQHQKKNIEKKKSGKGKEERRRRK
jgi:hypothetical protein